MSSINWISSETLVWIVGTPKCPLSFDLRAHAWGFFWNAAFLLAANFSLKTDTRAIALYKRERRCVH
jgi:hypothetical protein